MTVRAISNSEGKTNLKWKEWSIIGLKTALFSILSVLVIQAIALAIWPEVALFKPLDSYPRSALFTLVPAIGATAVFAWMVKYQSQPVKKFVILSGILLLLSFIPDYALPLENKTFLSSSVAAFMHLSAGIVTVATIVTSYRNRKA